MEAQKQTLNPEPIQTAAPEVMGGGSGNRLHHHPALQEWRAQTPLSLVLLDLRQFAVLFICRLGRC